MEFEKRFQKIGRRRMRVSYLLAIVFARTINNIVSDNVVGTIFCNVACCTAPLVNHTFQIGLLLISATPKIRNALSSGPI